MSGLPVGQATASMAALVRSGFTYAQIDAHVAAGRWQRCGRAVVLHNGPIHAEEIPTLALLNCGPRAALTGFTLAQARGLQGWAREEIDVLVPGGARIARPPDIPVCIHWSGRWSAEEVVNGRHALPPALVIAASTFATPRPAIGLLAAAVQQRLTSVGALRQAIGTASRARHRRVLLTALDDIGQGALALSEIDFARLCRRHGLPEPVRQAVRVEPSGRRRYLDAEWVTVSGRRLAVEVDGALHLAVRRWWDDQLRQNEVALADRTVLRFPSVVVRLEPDLVIDQIRRGLAL